jgi:two-component system cell cycle response regulator
MARSLASEHIVDVEVDPRQAMFHAAEASFDLAIVSLGLENYDGLRLCSRLRSLERTRNLPLLAITDAEDNARLMRGLEIGVNDYLIRPVDQNELLARVRTQIKKKRFAEKLRDNVQMSIEAAITDALTGLHNRRYMEIHLGTLVEQAGARGRPLSILVLDIDFFKAINDGYGHSAGDLKEFSRRLKKAVRGIDLACRFGGEEFVVVMPDTSVAMASMVAERLRKRIATEPFRINQNTRTVQATISVGIAAMRSVEDRPSDIIRRADEALYRAKRQGRNRVVADAA